MISRFFSHIPQHLSSGFDIVALVGLTVWQGISTTIAFISSEDWDKVTGPHGLVFVLLCGLIVVWTKSVKDDAGKERRHKEIIAEQQKTFDRHFSKLNENNKVLTDLIVSSNRQQDRTSNAIMAMDKSIIRLSNELDDLNTIAAQCTAIKKPRARKTAAKVKEISNE